MRLPKFSMRSVIVAVLITAVDLAALRFMFGQGNGISLVFGLLGVSPMAHGIDLVIGLLGVLPMANILAVGVYRTIARKDAIQPFFLGFALSGLIAMLVWFNLWLSVGERFLSSLGIWIREIVRGTAGQQMAWINRYKYFQSSLVVTCLLEIGQIVLVALLATIPQLILSFLGGILAGRIIKRPGHPRVVGSTVDSRGMM